MADPTPVPVIASVRAAFSFFTAHWTRFAPAAALLALAATMMTHLGGALMLVAGLAWLAINVAYRTALIRFALGDGYSGPLGLRLGADEGRLALINLMLGIFLILVFLVSATPLGILVLGLAFATGDAAAIQSAPDSVTALQAMGPQAGAVLRFGMLLVLLLLLFIYTRLALAEVASVGERRIVFLKSWPWTRDSFWRLLAALILAGLPGFFAGNILSAFGAMLSMSGAGPAAILFSFAGAFVVALLGGMMNAGLLVYLYRGLRPAQDLPAAPHA